LLIVAALREHPMLRLDFALRVRKNERLPLTTYRLRPGCSAAAEVALRRLGGSISLRPSPIDGWLDIPESFNISIPDLLLTSIELRSESAGSFVLRRSLSRLLLLKRDEATRIYVESTRAELSETYLIVAHRSLTHDLDGLLPAIA